MTTLTHCRSLIISFTKNKELEHPIVHNIIVSSYSDKTLIVFVVFSEVTVCSVILEKMTGHVRHTQALALFPPSSWFYTIYVKFMFRTYKTKRKGRAWGRGYTSTHFIINVVCTQY